MKKFLKWTGISVAGLLVIIIIIAISNPSQTNQAAPTATVQPAPSAATPTLKPVMATPTPAPTVAPTPQPVVTPPPATLTTLGAGTFYVGKDITTGRYVVSTTNTGGNFFVYDPSGMPVVNEMLGKDTEMYVNNITIELVEGQKIEISGLNAVKFTPKA
jgi:hypothetical protein